MEQNIDLLKNKIEEAELVLVGIGEEFGLSKKSFAKQHELFFGQLSEEKQWLLPFLYHKASDAAMIHKAYNNLSKLLEGKNYFVVSTRTDDRIYSEEFGLLKERIVTPCGGVRKLQCIKNCSDSAIDIPEQYVAQLNAMYHEVMNEDQDINSTSMERMNCPICGEPMEFNCIGAEKYCEQGYLQEWSRYTKWLQGTLNHKLCVIELGVGMEYPSVIRWPFEKMAYFNNKASFIRVHSKLYHLSEELKEKGISIAQNPIDFIANTFE